MNRLLLISLLLLPSLAFCQVSYPCDTSLWQHVYNKYRLDVKEECKTVTGIVVAKKKEKDGDYHIRIKLDSGQMNLLNNNNIAEQKGCLVIEIICASEITQTDASGPCNEYINHVGIPAIGQLVKVTGSYVLDKQHGWMEIHPVTNIEVEKCIETRKL